jgi:hypothetical protein
MITTYRKSQCRRRGGQHRRPAALPAERPGSDWNDLARRQGHAPIATALRGALDQLQQARVQRTNLTGAAANEQRLQQVPSRGLRM